MGSRDEFWLDAQGLRLQIEDIIRVVEARARRDPDHELDAETRGMIFAILSVIDDRYGPKFLLSIRTKMESWELSSEGPTAEKMWLLLGSIRGSLERLETREREQGIYGATTEAASPWGSSAQHPNYPPDESEDWPGDEGVREYRTGAGSQYRRATANRSRQRPWRLR